jgi:uncharacterized membrane protein (DUF373 family)
MWKLKEAGASIDSRMAVVFRTVSDLIVKLLVPLAIIALLIGVARVFVDLFQIWKGGTISAGFDTLVTDILSMFVVIELMKSVVEYFEYHRFRISLILDAAMVFLLREVMIGLYTHAMGAPAIAAISGLLLVLGALRLVGAKYDPDPPRVVNSTT